MEGQLLGPGSPSHGAADCGGCLRAMEIPLQPPPPVQRVMDPGMGQVLKETAVPRALMLKWATGSQLDLHSSAPAFLRTC